MARKDGAHRTGRRAMTAHDLMTPNPSTIPPQASLAEA